MSTLSPSSARGSTCERCEIFTGIGLPCFPLVLLKRHEWHDVFLAPCSSREACGPWCDSDGGPNGGRQNGLRGRSQSARNLRDNPELCVGRIRWRPATCFRWVHPRRRSKDP